ncbi:hydroxymethylglutaryl-CoA reductase, degradative [Planctomycetota bacterium]
MEMTRTRKAPLTSRFPAFYKMSCEERLTALSELVQLSDGERQTLLGRARPDLSLMDRMIENVAGVHSLPIGFVMNLRVNGLDRIAPMVTEEPSVVAGCSAAAKLLRASEGVATTCTPPIMIAQIQMLDLSAPDQAAERIHAAREQILREANDADPALVRAGGGARGVEVRRLDPQGADDPAPVMLIVHLLVDVRDAMGANAVNTMAEKIAPLLVKVAGGRTRLRIVSNLADRRLVVARGTVSLDLLARDGLSGSEVAKGVEEASVFAERDPYRAATHNKGIMNGVDAFLVAMGQDFRAVEAGAHAYAARSGRYRALSTWRHRGSQLEGELAMPMAVGTVGGISRVHPTVRVLHRIAGIRNAQDLAAIAGAVGLAQNLAALRALAAEGIQRGHMRLHARNLAASAGAVGTEVDAVARAMLDGGHPSHQSAIEALGRLRA